MFPHASVASHVLVMVYDPAQAPAIVISLEVITGVASQASVAVVDPVFAGNVLSSHSMVTSGAQVMTGGVIS